MTERQFQKQLIDKLKAMFFDCVIIKPARAAQGIPDLLILFRDKWAFLELKKSPNEPYQPNQEYYIEKFGDMSFASVIHPQNEEQVLHDLQLAFGVA